MTKLPPPPSESQLKAAYKVVGNFDNTPQMLRSAELDHVVTSCPLRLAMSGALVEGWCAHVRVTTGEVLGVFPNTKPVLNYTDQLSRYDAFADAAMCGELRPRNKPGIVWAVLRPWPPNVLTVGGLYVSLQVILSMCKGNLSVQWELVEGENTHMSLGTFTHTIPGKSPRAEMDSIIGKCYNFRSTLQSLDVEIPDTQVGEVIRDHIDPVNSLAFKISSNRPTTYLDYYWATCWWADFQKTVHADLQSPAHARVHSKWFGAIKETKAKALKRLLQHSGDL